MVDEIPTSERAPRKFTAPRSKLPDGACDGHVHMISDGSDYPLYAKRVETPAHGDFAAWLADCRNALSFMGFSRVVFVHSILFGSDNAITLDATNALGHDAARAVVLVQDGATPAELVSLREKGAAAVRLNYVHGGILSWEGAVAMAPDLADAGMHVQMLLNTESHMDQIADDIRAMPVPVVIDHLGWPDLQAGVDAPGFQLLRELVSEGHAYVKLSALYRYASAPFSDAAPFVQALVRANPERCLWGSDWPHLMLGTAGMPDTGALLNCLLECVSDTDLHRILVENAEELYGFDPAKREPAPKVTA